MKFALATLATFTATASAFMPSAFVGKQVANAPKSSSALDMTYKVAVVGGGPAGACAAEIFAQEKGIDTVLFERKLDNAKPCGGAIPLCMVGEFDLPESVVDRKVCIDCRIFGPTILYRIFSNEVTLFSACYPRFAA
jgi:geranylgeranyl diphosphate/geranylgeranyl-bacteriochlorophyllide a reductase